MVALTGLQDSSCQLRIEHCVELSEAADAGFNDDRTASRVDALRRLGAVAEYIDVESEELPPSSAGSGGAAPDSLPMDATYLTSLHFTPRARKRGGSTSP